MNYQKLTNENLKKFALIQFCDTPYWAVSAKMTLTIVVDVDDVFFYTKNPFSKGISRYIIDFEASKFNFVQDVDS